jgi:A/G-specific adenine glycosylase
MLQQTRVDTARGYFQRWMERFPSVDALATAPTDDVLAAWSGLGYYARARNLQSAAREVVARYGGRVPSSLDELKSLPGVGPYTAGAIASIAYEQPAPIVDGNVTRVLARVALLERDVRAPQTQRSLWRIAARIVQQAPPSEVNQALMELGALVCTPTRPACLTCPLREHCGGRRSGRAEALPGAPRRTKAPTVELAAAWLVDGQGRTLLARRGPEGLFGGLWELPMVEVTEPTAAPGKVDTPDLWASSEALRRWLGDRLGVAVVAHETLGTVNHVLSHRRLVVAAQRCALVDDAPPRPRAAAPYDGYRWIEPGALATGRRTRGVTASDGARLGLSALTLKLLTLQFTPGLAPGIVESSFPKEGSRCP